MAAVTQAAMPAHHQQQPGFRFGHKMMGAPNIQYYNSRRTNDQPTPRSSSIRSNLTQQYALPLRSTHGLPTANGSTGTASSNSEHLLRRKTPSGSLTAAYDGTPMESSTKTHASKHFLIPVDDVSSRIPRLNETGPDLGYLETQTLFSSSSNTFHNGQTGEGTIPKENYGVIGGGGISASPWQYQHRSYSSYPTAHVDAPVQTMHGQYGQAFHSQTLYHGPNAMQPPFQAPIAPTISNNQGPFGPYWPNGTFVPYQPAPYRDPRYGLQNSSWEGNPVQAGLANITGPASYNQSARPLHMSNYQTQTPANATSRPNSYRLVNDNSSLPTGNHGFPNSYYPEYSNSGQLGYADNDHGSGPSYICQRPGAMTTPHPYLLRHEQATQWHRRETSSAMQSDESYDPDKLLRWALSIYSELVNAVQQARRQGSELQGSTSQPHFPRINIYPEPVKKSQRREQSQRQKATIYADDSNAQQSTQIQHHTDERTNVSFPLKESLDFQFSNNQHLWPSDRLRHGNAQYGQLQDQGFPNLNESQYTSSLNVTPQHTRYYPPRQMTDSYGTNLFGNQPDIASKAAHALDLLAGLCHKDNSQWIECLLLGGSLAYVLGDFQTALAWYSKILELDNNHVEAMSNLAATHLSVNRRRDAEQYWRHTIKLRPSYFEAVEHLVGLLCFEQRNKDAIQIIEFVQNHLRSSKGSHAENHTVDQEGQSATSRSPSHSFSISDLPDKIYVESSHDRDHYSPTLSAKSGAEQQSSRYSISGADNGRIMSLIHAKGNMLYNLQNHTAAARAFEEVVLVAAGERTGGIDAFVKSVSSTLSKFRKRPSQSVEDNNDPLLLTPDQALQTARLCFPPDGQLPGLQGIGNAMSRKAAISVTSNSLLSLAKIFQDGMHPSPSNAGTARVTCSVHNILALYYLSLSLQPSPSTANNVGILMASVQQSIVPKQPDASTKGDYYLFPGVIPGSGIALALTYYNYGLNLDSKHAHLFTNLGSLLKDIGQLSTAIKMYEKAVAWDPNFDIALANLANAVKDQGKTSNAIAYYRRAVQVNPNFAEAVCGLANALNSICDWQGRGGVRIPGWTFDRWHVDEIGNLVDSRMSEKPVNGWMKRVVDIVDGQLKEGETFGKGLLQSGLLSTLLKQINQGGTPDAVHERAEQSVGATLHRWANQPWEGSRVVRFIERATRRIGWEWYQDKYVTRKEKSVASYARPQLPIHVGTPQAPTVLPFHTFTFPMTARQIRLISQRNGLRVSCSTLKASWLPRTVFSPPAPPSPRLNVGYVSSDFNNHPLAHLMQSVFGMHDIDRVNVFCYATTPGDGSVHRQQIERESPQFYDASSWPVERVVKQIVEDNIHILINLNGYTRGARNEIFAARPAPIQMAFMGFAGTLGAEWCDYLLADETAIPTHTLRPYRNNVTLEDLAADENSGSADESWVYGENIIYTRSSFFCTDHRQTGSGADERALTWADAQKRRREMRRELFPHLSDNAIIFGNFNQLYKIDPTTFRTWLRILGRVPNSILWLLRFPDLGEAHLRATATAWAGAAIASRIVFTDVAPKTKHIARACVADLFLDTPECNAHTTAADCLWSGTPLLTLPRYDWKMCSRMAAGILKGALPQTKAGEDAWNELVCDSEEEYEEMAVWLGKSLRFRQAEELVEVPLDVNTAPASEATTTAAPTEPVAASRTGKKLLEKAAKEMDTAHANTPSNGRNHLADSKSNTSASSSSTNKTATSTERPTRKVIAKVLIPEGRLIELRKLLWTNRWTCRLFDTKRWVGDLEDAYEEAWKRWVDGRGGDIWLKDL